ncbi:hypothetical protein [Thermococcus sp. M36]|uniref:hypothetical protein n=1 Tax=Thermococcus sp. M36 TaxID=1638261 RepID=UPI00143AD075|nr:hypothetical protein [Thermococcus sp. M36]
MTKGSMAYVAKVTEALSSSPEPTTAPAIMRPKNRKATDWKAIPLFMSPVFRNCSLNFFGSAAIWGLFFNLL